MAKHYVVARGEIHRDNKVIAREGGEYKPKNAAERDRLVARGIIVEVEGGRQGGSQAASAGGGDTPPAGTGQQDDEGGEGGGGTGDQNAGG